MPSGIYKVSVGAVSRNANRVQPYRLSYSTDKSSYTDTDVYISYTTGTAGSVQTPSANIQLTDPAYLRLTNYYGSDGSNAQDYLDYVLIRRVSDEATIASSGYSSFCSAYPLDFTGGVEGLTAYYVEEATTGASSIALKEVEGTVAAGTGLILKGTASTEYSIPVVADGTDLSATNKLTGVLANTVIDQNFAGYENIYVLSSGQFQNVNNWIESGNTVTIPAGKSYLTADAAAVKALNAFINGEATGIESVATESNLFDGATYNLSGQRVSNGYKGIVIRNGKKYLVK